MTEWLLGRRFAFIDLPKVCTELFKGVKPPFALNVISQVIALSNSSYERTEAGIKKSVAQKTTF